MFSKSKEELENEVAKKAQCHVVTIKKTTSDDNQEKPLIIKTYKIREENEEEEKKDENHKNIPKKPEKPKIFLKKEEKPIIDLKIAEKTKISIKAEEKPKISLNNDIKPKIEIKPKEVTGVGGEQKKEEKPKSLFDLSSSIFSSNQNLQGKSLFQTGGTSSLFGNSNFNFTSLSSTNNFFSNQKKEEDNEDDDKEDDVFNDKEEQEKEPPTKLVPQDISLFNKKFSKHINQLYLYDSKAKKFTPRGNGFLSVEISKDDQVKKAAVVIFRNQIGTKIIEGFITPEFQKFESYKKNYKDVATFGYLELKEDKPTIGLAKVPFALEDEFKDFQKAYKEAADFIIKNKDKNK